MMPKRKTRLGAGDLILNTPFAEPSKYWSYDRKHMVFTQIEGRRPAGYIVATPNAQGFNDPGQFIELGLVNQIRPRVKAWREANYPGATGITRRLLEHWHDPNQREGMRFFFCQMEAIWFENTTKLEPVFDTHRPLLSTSDMRPWYTSRPCEATTKSHISVVVYDSRWEASEAYYLEKSKLVDRWVKNDHLGFEILYAFRGAVRKYRPDFLVALQDGTMVIVEIKGQETDETRAKHRFLDEWVRAINGCGNFGTWRWTVVNDAAKIEEHLSDV